MQKNKNSSVARGKERGPMLVSNYSTCGKKNPRFLKPKQKQQAEGLLSLLGIKQSFQISGNWQFNISIKLA